METRDVSACVSPEQSTSQLFVDCKVVHFPFFSATACNSCDRDEDCQALVNRAANARRIFTVTKLTINKNQWERNKIIFGY